MVHDLYSVAGDGTTSLRAGSVFSRGQSFTATRTTTLNQVSFRIAKVGTPPGNVTAYIWNHTGDLSTGSTSAVLATSTSIVASSLSTSTNAHTTFVFPSPLSVTAGTNYVVGIGYNNGDASNHIILQILSSGATHIGSHYSGSSATVLNGSGSGFDTIFVLHDTSGPGNMLQMFQ